MSSTTNPPHEAVEIDINSMETSISRLVCLIRPTWVSKKLNIKKLSTDDNDIHYSITPIDIDDERYGVIIKIHPANSDVYTDHQAELQLIDQFSRYEITPRVLLTFINGYFSNYILGKPLDDKEEYTQ